MKQEPTFDYGLTKNFAYGSAKYEPVSIYANLSRQDGTQPVTGGINATYDLTKYIPNFLSGATLDLNNDSNYSLDQNNTSRLSNYSSLRMMYPYESEDQKLTANIGATGTLGYKPYFYGDVNYRLNPVESPHNFNISARADNLTKPSASINYSYTNRF